MNTRSFVFLAPRLILQPLFVFSIAAGIAIGATGSASAQGLLGNMLRGALEKQKPQAEAQQTVPPQQQLSGRTGVVTTTTMEIKGDHWVVRDQQYFGGAMSLAACQADLLKRKSLIVWLAAVHPAARLDPSPYAVIVKDGIDRNDPQWHFSILTCSGNTPRPHSGDDLDAGTISAMAELGMDAPVLLAQATDFVSQTDGRFPPGPSATQQALGKVFAAVVVVYGPNGVMQETRTGDPFATAQECDRYIATKLKVMTNQSGGTILGTAVFAADDASGFIWALCAHPAEVDSKDFLDFASVKMTLQRAKTMPRIRDTSPSSTQPSKRGNQIKF